jgi:hypothetical protein
MGEAARHRQEFAVAQPLAGLEDQERPVAALMRAEESVVERVGHSGLETEGV